MSRELAMGINAVEGLVRHAPERVVRVWIRPAHGRLERLEDSLRRADISVEHADGRTLDRMAGGTLHQGVIAEFQPRRPGDDRRLTELLEGIDAQALFLVLDGVQDPGNLGACLSPIEHQKQCLCINTLDRKSTRLNSSHVRISYAVF